MKANGIFIVFTWDLKEGHSSDWRLCAAGKHGEKEEKAACASARFACSLLRPCGAGRHWGGFQGARLLPGGPVPWLACRCAEAYGYLKAQRGDLCPPGIEPVWSAFALGSRKCDCDECASQPSGLCIDVFVTVWSFVEGYAFNFFLVLKSLCVFPHYTHV